VFTPLSPFPKTMGKSSKSGMWQVDNAGAA
jgi:hypothetical protein